uniref:Transport protein n=1 Tax=Lysinibacillus macroides TaxID=33935 RepID=Q9F4B9_9BACI|nr:transport protein [Lysinibacillus macroides]
MKNILNSTGWFLVALVTCPCHLFLLVPLLAGTAVGSYFAEFKEVSYIVLALLFGFSLYMGGRKLFFEPTKESNKETQIDTKKETKKHDCCNVERFKS